MDEEEDSIEVEVPNGSKARRRLEEYKPKDTEDDTVLLFGALLDHAPPLGKTTIIEWILLPSISGKGSDVEGIQSENRNICDDNALYMRAKAWRTNLIKACTGLEVIQVNSLVKAGRRHITTSGNHTPIPQPTTFTDKV